MAVAVNELECKEERALEDCGTMAKENPPLTVCLPWTNHFLYFDFFYVLTGVLLQGMVESCLLSKDELLTTNIDKVMAV